MAKTVKDLERVFTPELVGDLEKLSEGLEKLSEQVKGLLTNKQLLELLDFGMDLEIENPCFSFLMNEKSGRFDKLSSTEYEELLDKVCDESSAFNNVSSVRFNAAATYRNTNASAMEFLKNVNCLLNTYELLCVKNNCREMMDDAVNNSKAVTE